MFPVECLSKRQDNAGELFAKARDFYAQNRGNVPGVCV